MRGTYHTMWTLEEACSMLKIARQFGTVCLGVCIVPAGSWQVCLLPVVCTIPTVYSVRGLVWTYVHLPDGEQISVSTFESSLCLPPFPSLIRISDSSPTRRRKLRALLSFTSLRASCMIQRYGQVCGVPKDSVYHWIAG